MKTRTKQILSIMQVLCWIIFIGLCIKVGAVLYSFSISVFVNPETAKHLLTRFDMSYFKGLSQQHFIGISLLIVIVSVMKACLFYLVIKAFSRINFVHPFSKEVSSLIAKISYVAVSIGILTLTLMSYRGWLTGRGLAFYMLQYVQGGGAEFLFFAGVIFVISLFFKRGIELQSEIELTV